MQHIGGSLYHLAMSAVTDKDTATRLSEVVEVLTHNNAYITAQLGNAIKLNLEMSKRLNLKPTQEKKLENSRKGKYKGRI